VSRRACSPCVGLLFGTASTIQLLAGFVLAFDERDFRARVRSCPADRDHQVTRLQARVRREAAGDYLYDARLDQGGACSPGLQSEPLKSPSENFARL
jgi:hypothetical protein